MKRLRKFFASADSRFRNMFRRRRLSIVDPELNDEIWFAHMSVAEICGGVLAAVLLMFFAVLLLVAYTPVLNILPDYRTFAARSRGEMIEEIIRIDSLEHKINQMLAYNESIIMVSNGQTPTTRTIERDTTQTDKSIVPPSRADSLLRRQMEGDGPYSLGRSVADNARIRTVAGTAVAPVYGGIVSEHFNVHDGLYGIRISTAAEAQVVAVADGTVISVEWSPATGHCATIQHDNGLISIYRHLGSLAAERGRHIRTSETVGYTAAAGEGEGQTLLELELWSDGKPVDPESLIIF